MPPLQHTALPPAEQRIGIHEQTTQPLRSQEAKLEKGDDGDHSLSLSEDEEGEDDGEAAAGSSCDSVCGCSERRCRAACVSLDRRCCSLQPSCSGQSACVLLLCVLLVSAFVGLSISFGGAPRYPALAVHPRKPQLSAHELAEWQPQQQQQQQPEQPHHVSLVHAASEPPLPCLSCSLCTDIPLSPEVSWYSSGDYATFLVVVTGATTHTPHVQEFPKLEDVANRFRLRRWTDQSLRTEMKRQDTSATAAAESQRLTDLGVPRIEWSYSDIEPWMKTTRLLRGVVVFPDRPSAESACKERSARNASAQFTCVAPTDNVEDRFKRDCCLSAESAAASIAAGSVHSSCSLPFPSSLHGFYTLEAVGLTPTSPPIQWYRAPWASNAPPDPLRWPATDMPQWDDSVKLPPADQALQWPLSPGVRSQCVGSIVITHDQRTCAADFDWSVREDLGMLMVTGKDVAGRPKTQGQDVLGVRFVQQAASAAMKPDAPVVIDSVAAGPVASATARRSALDDLSAQNSVQGTSLRRDNDVVFAAEGRTYAPIVVDLLNGSYIVPLPTATRQQRMQIFEMRKAHAVGTICDGGDDAQALECTHTLMPDDVWRESMSRSHELVRAAFMEGQRPTEEHTRYRADMSDACNTRAQSLSNAHDAALQPAC